MPAPQVVAAPQVVCLQNNENNPEVVEAEVEPEVVAAPQIAKRNTRGRVARRAVWSSDPRDRMSTVGGLPRKKLTKNAKGKIVSKKSQQAAEKTLDYGMQRREEGVGPFGMGIVQERRYALPHGEAALRH